MDLDGLAGPLNLSATDMSPPHPPAEPKRDGRRPLGPLFPSALKRLTRPKRRRLVGELVEATCETPLLCSQCVVIYLVKCEGHPQTTSHD